MTSLPMLRSLLLLSLLVTGVSAVPLRVVTFNIEANRNGSTGLTEARSMNPVPTIIIPSVIFSLVSMPTLSVCRKSTRDV